MRFIQYLIIGKNQVFGKLLTNQKIAYKIVKPYVYKALREGLKFMTTVKYKISEGSIPSLSDVGYRVTSRSIKAFRARNTSALADERPEVRQAMGLRSAMNPSGISWLMWSDGSNENAIAQIASQIQDLDTVATAYRSLYSDDLLKDLQKELSTELFNAFLQCRTSHVLRSIWYGIKSSQRRV
jgi:hypothetical protein